MRRLVGSVRAEQILRAAGVQVEGERPRGLRGPDSEAWLRRAGIARLVDCAKGVDVLNSHARSASGELRLREGIYLCPAEAVAAPRVRVGRDVESVRVRANVGVVAKVRAGVNATRVRS